MLSSLDFPGQLKDAGISFYINEPLSKYTTWGAGGPAAFMANVNSADELIAVLKIARKNGVDVFIMGKGSNILVADRGYAGLVIKLSGDFCKITAAAGNRIIAGGGATLAKLSAFAKDNLLTGLEFASDIPGTLGGAVKSNAGAFRQSISGVLEKAELLDIPSLAIEEIKPEFGYRTSNIKDKICLNATFKLKKAEKESIESKLNDYALIRTEKQPTGRSAGSVFKNPDNHIAAKLLEEAGCKNLSRGTAVVSSKHANFIINKGGASASDVLQLIKICAQKVYNSTGVKLEPEVIFLGFGKEELTGVGKQA